MHCWPRETKTHKVLTAQIPKRNKPHCGFGLSSSCCLFNEAFHNILSLRMNLRNVGGNCIMFIALLTTRNKNSQGANSANPKTQQTSLWFRVVVFLLSIRSYPLYLCPAPVLQWSFLAASSSGNQIEQPLLVLPNQALKL